MIFPLKAFVHARVHVFSRCFQLLWTSNAVLTEKKANIKDCPCSKQWGFNKQHGLHAADMTEDN